MTYREVKRFIFKKTLQKYKKYNSLGTKSKKNFLLVFNCLTISEKKIFMKKIHFCVEHIDKNVIFAADLNTN